MQTPQYLILSQYQCVETKTKVQKETYHIITICIIMKCPLELKLKRIFPVDHLKLNT